MTVLIHITLDLVFIDLSLDLVSIELKNYPKTVSSISLKEKTTGCPIFNLASFVASAIFGRICLPVEAVKFFA